jgi:hypothetical protein
MGNFYWPEKQGADDGNDKSNSNRRSFDCVTRKVRE